MISEIVGSGYCKVVSNMVNALDEEARRGPKEPPPMSKHALGHESRYIVQWMYCFRDTPSRRAALQKAQHKAAAVAWRDAPSEPASAARIVEWNGTLWGGGLERITRIALAS